MLRIVPVTQLVAVAIVLCALSSALSEPGPAEKEPTERPAVTKGRLLEGCGRDDPFAPLLGTTASKSLQHEPRERPQQAPDQQPALTLLRLTGTMRINGLPKAIINDTFFQVGDTVMGAIVVSIDDDGVVLKINGKKERLKIGAALFVEATERTLGQNKGNSSSKHIQRRVTDSVSSPVPKLRRGDTAGRREETGAQGSSAQ